jgi:hypothetical protein
MTTTRSRPMPAFDELLDRARALRPLLEGNAARGGRRPCSDENVNVSTDLYVGWPQLLAVIQDMLFTVS